MMPYMAQGAAQATEDAATLASALASSRTLSSALHTYQTHRLPRATYIARNTRILQQWWHLYDGPERDRRDELMKTDSEMNPMLWGCKERKDWLFGYDARTLLGDGEEVVVPGLPPTVGEEADVYRRSRVEVNGDGELVDGREGSRL